MLILVSALLSLIVIFCFLKDMELIKNQKDKNCRTVDSYEEAKSLYIGGMVKLDGNKNGIPCEKEHI